MRKYIIVAREPICSLNAGWREFLLDEDNEVMRFSSEEIAREFLSYHGINDLTDIFFEEWFAAYKIVQRDFAGRLCSFIALYEEKVLYPRNRIIVAPKHRVAEGYHLLVYETYEDTKQFGSQARVYECLCREKIVPIPPRLTACGAYGCRSDHDLLWPKGTIMVEELLMGERV